MVSYEKGQGLIKMYVINKNVFAIKENSDYLLLNMDNGKFYGLDSLGSEIWELISKNYNLDKIVSILRSRFEIDPRIIEQDVLKYVTDLVENGLVSNDEQI